MNYNARELREKLEEKVLRLGIDHRFKENPAYASALAEIESLITQMNMFEASEVVPVREQEGKISFDWNSPFGDKYSLDISCSSPETFKCVRVEEKRPSVLLNGQVFREKTVIEKIATIDKSGFITLVTNSAKVDNFDCRIGECNNSTWSEKDYYTLDGVMRDREYKSFSKGLLSEDFDNTKVDSMLYIPRRAFDFGGWSDKYDTRTLLNREMLDTARMVYENKSKGIRYSAIVPLNQEHGLRNMRLLGGYDSYPQEVFIPTLSKEQIESMLQRESNLKVVEGLRKYAIGRENYSYNSFEDRNFVREGFSESKSISK